MIDSTCVRAHQHAAGARHSEGSQGLGRSAGGLTSKLHLCFSENAGPQNFVLSAGNEHDIKHADKLCKNLSADTILLADKGYDCNDFRINLLLGKVLPVIPYRQNRALYGYYDKKTYKIRYKIECFFGRLKQFRGFASRYDKYARSFLAGVAILCAVIAFK